MQNIQIFGTSTYTKELGSNESSIDGYSRLTEYEELSGHKVGPLVFVVCELSYYSLPLSLVVMTYKLSQRSINTIPYFSISFKLMTTIVGRSYTSWPIHKLQIVQIMMPSAFWQGWNFTSCKLSKFRIRLHYYYTHVLIWTYAW